MERDKEGFLLVESSCAKCGACKTFPMRDDSMKKWESEHVCSNVRVIRPKRL
jgi:hypothetical protein